MTWVVENHDVVRTPTRYGSAARARAALLAVLGLPGTAYLYQGQELGLPEADVPPAARRDPAWARSGRSRDGCRVPLPWTRSPVGAHGFSPAGGAPPWLPVPDGWGEFAVEAKPAALRLTRAALRLRRQLHASGVLTVDDPLEWTVGPGDRLTVERGRFTLAVAMGARAVSLPPGEVLLTSEPLTADGLLPADAAAWVLRS